MEYLLKLIIQILLGIAFISHSLRFVMLSKHNSPERNGVLIFAVIYAILSFQWYHQSSSWLIYLILFLPIGGMILQLSQSAESKAPVVIDRATIIFSATLGLTAIIFLITEVL